MTIIAAITMVQSQDLPWALASLKSIRQMSAPDGVELKRIVLLNDKSDNRLEQDLAEAVGGAVICDGRNLGVAGGRNRLVRAAEAEGAEFIASIDDDILLPSDYLAVLWSAYQEAKRFEAPTGILTPSTLDYPSLKDLLYEGLAQQKIECGEVVTSPECATMRDALKTAGLKPEHIYHMGIRDWRGCYLFGATPVDQEIQATYGIAFADHQGPQSNLRAAPEAASLVLEPGNLLPIDSAPGGICFYSIAAFNAVGGIDEAFNPFGFEDADFALRLKRLGYQHYCAPASIAVHDIAKRLSNRAPAVIKAGQGKAIGIFLRRHSEGKEACAAGLAFGHRILHELSPRAPSKVEKNDGAPSVHRLKTLFAYASNFLTFALPTGNGDDQAFPQQVLRHIEGLLSALIPPNGKIEFEQSGNQIWWKRPDECAPLVAIECLEDLEKDSVRIVFHRFRLTIPRRFAPRLLEYLCGTENVEVSLSGTLKVHKNGDFGIEYVTVRTHGGFTLTLNGSGNRSQPDESDRRPISLDRVKIDVRDEGALSRYTKFFSDVEKRSPRELIQTWIEELAPQDGFALQNWLNGDADTVTLYLSGVVDGDPNHTKFKVAATPNVHASVNKSQRQRLKEAKIPKSQSPNTIAGSQTRSLRGELPLSPALQRLLRPDPSIVPFPDTYNPSQSQKASWKLRYLAASRGMPLTPNERRMLRFKESGVGRRAFIIGNGPSLNDLDLRQLKDEATFGVNAIYLNRDRMGFLPTHYVVEDVYVAEDRANEINALEGPTKWVGNYLRYCLTGNDQTCWMNVACDYSNYPEFPHFSSNASRIVWVGGTVSYIVMQLAFYMGYNPIYLVGFDHNYTIPNDAKISGASITSTSSDPNHFHPDYFGKGYRWHDPRVDRMETAYRRAREVFEISGKKIYNATAGGKLEVFERVDYASLFESKRQKTDKFA